MRIADWNSHISKEAMKLPEKKTKRGGDSGFSLTELLIVVAIISVVSSFALLYFQKSRKSFNITGAMRTLSSYVEKTRVDSIRRHGGASIDINSATSYTVNVDFDGTGTATARTIDLPQGTTLSYTLPPANTSIDPSATPITIAYNWRGRAGTTVLLTLTDSTASVGSSSVMVGSVGDVSTDTSVTGPVTTPTPQTAVATTTGIKSMH